MNIGDVVNMSNFTHVQIDGKNRMEFSFMRLKRKTYVFMYLGIEEDNKPLDLIEVMHVLGWKEIEK